MREHHKPAIIPRPLQSTCGTGHLALDRTIGVCAAPDAIGVARWLSRQLDLDALLEAPSPHDGARRIVLRINEELGPECYELAIEADGVEITGGDAAGAFYGAQSLVQLLPPDVLRAAFSRTAPWKLPQLRISDGPAYRWRGLLIDVARHFLPKREIMRLVDIAALHKLNTLQLHLTDDQGWRVEIKRHPRLTEVGAWRSGTQVGTGGAAFVNQRPHGGYYTQDDLREIVQYARERHITVVPEIDCPGHVQAAIAAYPALGTSTDAVSVGTRWGISDHLLAVGVGPVDFFREVLDEVMDIFPSPYIAIGADETLRGPWERVPDLGRRLEALGLQNVSEFLPWFVSQMEVHVSSRGRRLLGWDEIVECPPSRADTVIGAWRGQKAVSRAISAGFDVVACPDDVVYLNYRQSELDEEPIPIGVLIDLRKAYEFSPAPAQFPNEGARRVLGGQASLWTEIVDSPRQIDYHLFPRLAAIAESLWSGPGGDFDEFTERIEVHEKRLEALGVEYRPSTGPLPWQQRPDAPGSPITSAERERRMQLQEAGIHPDSVPGWVAPERS